MRLMVLRPAGVLVTLTLAATVAGAAIPAAPAPAVALVEILNRYGAGQYEAALVAIDGLDSLDRAFTELRLAAPAWIQHGPSGSVSRRRLVAATVALEIAHARRTLSWRARWPFVVWGCELLRDASARSHAERAWYLASVAVMEEAGDWTDLAGVPKESPNLPARRFFSPADQQEYRAGHLSHARAAFPNEPRFRLAQVIVREHATFLDATPGPPPHGIAGEEVPPALVATLTDRAAGNRVEAVADLSPDAAKKLLGRIALIPAIAREFATLSRYDGIRGEVELHLGFADLRLQSWDSALGHFAQVPRLGSEPFVVALSHMFAGWALQRSGRRDAAVAAYRQAQDVAPAARSVSILLAAELAESGQTAEAYGVMDRALKANPAPADAAAIFASGRPPADPWTAFKLGDARLFPEFIARVREVLR